MIANPASPDSAELRRLVDELARRYAAFDAAHCVLVDIAAQRLHFLLHGELAKSYDVSTASRGIGNRLGSEQTPLGVFQVAEKHGDGAVPGAVFKGRVATGEIAPLLTDPHDPAENDLVTSRILWLDGLQPGFNRGGEFDTRERYIYIHGTPEEGRIGRPASHGCVRMRNADVIELYRRMPVGGLVCIVAGDAPLSEIPGPLPAPSAV